MVGILYLQEIVRCSGKVDGDEISRGQFSGLCVFLTSKAIQSNMLGHGEFSVLVKILRKFFECWMLDISFFPI